MQQSLYERQDRKMSEENIIILFLPFTYNLLFLLCFASCLSFFLPEKEIKLKYKGKLRPFIKRQGEE